MDAAAPANTAKPQKPVVLYPSPGMGHLVSMIELGKLFAARGLAVTIVIIDPPYDAGATGPFLAGVSAANPSVSFHRLPQVTLPTVASKHKEALTYETIRVSNPHLRDFLAGASPAVLVVDFFCSIALDVAAELGIATYFFFTSGAAVLAFSLHLPVLHARTTASFRDMGEELARVPGIPAFPATHVFLPIMDRDDKAYEGFLNTFTNFCRSQGIIVNTFRSLERRAIDTLTRFSRRASWAGPRTRGSSSSRGRRSAACWPTTRWAGSTHCGWNSVLEAIMAGVPMVAWPLYAEQWMNKVFLEEELHLAVPVEGYNKEIVKAEEVAAKVRCLMDSDGGRALRERTLAAMRRAKEALREGGESEATLARLVDAWTRA